MQLQLARIDVILSVASPPEVHGHGGPAAYGLLLEVCRGFEPALARAVHDGQGLKPLSLSPLTITDGQVRFSCGTLNTETTAGMVAALQHAADGRRPLALAGAEARVESVKTLSSSYHDLLTRASGTCTVDIVFVSPTLFRRSGESLVLPEPDLVFRSLLQTWNSFSPMQFPPHTADFAALMIRHHNIHTQLVDFGSYKLLGFVGRVSYLMPREMPRLLRRTINCLADYAFFAGVGYRTTMGMGVCRRV